MSASRENVLGLQRIKISEMLSLADRFGMIGTLDEYISIIQSIDAMYIEFINENAKAKNKSKDKDKDKDKDKIKDSDVIKRKMLNRN